MHAKYIWEGEKDESSPTNHASMISLARLRLYIQYYLSRICPHDGRVFSIRCVQNLSGKSSPDPV
jgi:hypothetical protein